MDLDKLKFLSANELFDNFDVSVKINFGRGAPMSSYTNRVSKNLKPLFDENEKFTNIFASKSSLGLSKDRETSRGKSNKENRHPNLMNGMCFDLGSKKSSRAILRKKDISRISFLNMDKSCTKPIDNGVPSEPVNLTKNPNGDFKKSGFESSKNHSANIVMLKRLIKEASKKPAPSLNNSVDEPRKSLLFSRRVTPNNPFSRPTPIANTSIESLRSKHRNQGDKPKSITGRVMENHTSKLSNLFHNSRLAESRSKQVSRSNLFQKKDSLFINNTQTEKLNLNGSKKELTYLNQFKQRYIHSKSHKSYSSIPGAPTNQYTQQLQQPARYNILTEASTNNYTSKYSTDRHTTDSNTRSDYVFITEDRPLSSNIQYNSTGASNKYIEINNIYNHYKRILNQKV